MDVDSPLYILRGNRDVLSHIHSFLRIAWQQDVLLQVLHSRQGDLDDRDEYDDDEYYEGLPEELALAHVADVVFPEAESRFVNMMPFIMNDLSSLPQDLHQAYGHIINHCIQTLPQDEQNTIGYLTVHESLVTSNNSHRRPGLHTEGFVNETWETSAVRETNFPGTCLEEPYWHPWGFGHAICPGKFSGGIFIASNVDDSCHLYDIQVPSEVVGPGGDLEHLRSVMGAAFPPPAHPRRRVNDQYMRCGGKQVAVGPANITSNGFVRHPISMQSGELYWITDRTPHESIPLPHTQPRSFFRLVAGRVGVWYAQHSTPNPRGTPPAARVVTHDKFTGEEVSSISKGVIGLLHNRLPGITPL